MKWNKALRPSYIISCRIQPDISNLPSSAVVISLVSLCQSWYYHNAISHYDTQFVCNFMLSMKSSNEKHHCFITWSLMVLYRLSSATQALICQTALILEEVDFTYISGIGCHQRKQHVTLLSTNQQ